MDHATTLFLALVIDAIVGDPNWLYRRAPHPVVWMGAAIGWLDSAWNEASHSDAVRRVKGVVAILILLAISAGAGWLIHAGLERLAHGTILEAVIASVFLAQNSLYRHVAAVEKGFAGGQLGPAQVAVSQIVGRDPASLDEAGVCRAAIESLAENFSDGIVAPAFWFCLFGLPGLLVYKALNTADSMIGHRNDRYRAFGWASARLDDVANLLPARIAAITIAMAAIFQAGGAPAKAVGSAFRDARHHGSVNAGWPEASMAGALGIRLAGPRRYAGVLVEDPWMGNGREGLVPNDIRRALGLYVRACIALLVFVAILVTIQA
jgi:adenosylcobinamide-phosphate synthase